MIDVYFDIVAYKLTHNDGWTATSADLEVAKRTEVDNINNILFKIRFIIDFTILIYKIVDNFFFNHKSI